VHIRLERRAPARQLEGCAQRALDALDRFAMDANGGGDNGDVARERLQHGQAEALTLGGYEHDVGRVDPQRYPCRVDAAERQQLDADGVRERERAVVALLRASWVSGEQEVGTGGVEAQLGACRAPRQRLEALEVHAAGQDLRAPSRGSAGEFRSELGGDRAEHVHQRAHRSGQQARARVAYVGAVHGERAHACADCKSGPRGQAEVGVHHVELFRLRGPREAAVIASVQIRHGTGERLGAGRELVQLDLEVGELAQRGDLVADEAPALGMGGVGEHVRDHQRAQDASTVASGMMPRVQAGPTQRSYGRQPDGLRPIAIEPGFMSTATGSALISAGETRVICTASAQESVPRWMAGAGKGWVTAEYGMLPASTGDRKQRDATRGRQDGRTIEIQRLIGRALRVVVDFEALGERTMYLDCDVLQADGGTRCASITGAYVALALACARLQKEGRLERSPLRESVAAVSCGIIDGVALLDLDYSEDSTAEVDANVVMTGADGLVEVQATAERTPLSRAHLDELLALAAGGIEQLRFSQEQAIAAGS
jgi:ribonuclease PH